MKFFCSVIHPYLIALATLCITVISAQPQGFVASSAAINAKPVEVDEGNVSADLDTASANYRQQQQQQTYEYEEEEEEEQAPVHVQQRQQQPINRRQQHQQQYVPRQGQTNKEILEELEEQEEPDRLTQLLEKSDFKCEGRTGYDFRFYLSSRQMH